ncbi:MAG: TPM domain-containing protein [Sporomusaceae bacterium]|nr:TPM domain-containing protein [Sporomusaceae bacterium]
MKKWLAWLTLLVYLLTGTAAFAAPNIPAKPAANIYVQDYAGVLSGATKSRIQSVGSALAERTKAQVVVVTVKSLEGAALEEYALALLRQWGIGDAQLNNGVLLLVSTGDRQSRVEVGYGLEGRLPDAKTGRIQDEYIIPYFRTGDYDKGILNGYLALAGEVAQEYNLELKADARPAPSRQSEPSGGWVDLPWWLQLLLVAGFLGLVILDWMFFGGRLTYLLVMLLRGGKGGGGGGGFGGGSGGGGGSSRRW